MSASAVSISTGVEAPARASLQQVEALAVRQPPVEDDGVVGVDVGLEARLLEGAGDVGPEPFGPQASSDRGGQVRLILHDQDPHRRHPKRGAFILASSRVRQRVVP